MPIRRTPEIGGFETQTSVSGDTTASKNEIILADASGGNITVTLPAPDGDEFQVVVKRTDTSSNTVTLATPNNQTIDTDSNRTLDTGLISRTVTSNGSNYFII